MKLNNLIAFWAGFLLIAFIAGCQSANPIAAADTNEQRAYAAYGTFVIAQEKAVDLVERSNVPRGVKLRIISAEERAKPVADSLIDTLSEFNEIRAEFDAGETTEDAVIAVSNSLDGWVNRLVPLVNELIRNLKGAED